MTGEPLLYHGTRAAFRGPGGLVVPGAQVGSKNHERGRNDVVFVTPDLELAWEMAEAAKGRNRPRVLVVEPFDLFDVNTDLADYGYVEFGCSGARVKRVIMQE